MWILTLRFLLLKLHIQFTTISIQYLPFPIALYPNMLLFLHVWEPSFKKQKQKKKIVPFCNLAPLSGTLPITKQETYNAYLTTHLHIIIPFPLSLSLTAEGQVIPKWRLTRTSIYLLTIHSPGRKLSGLLLSLGASQAAADVWQCCWWASLPCLIRQVEGWLASSPPTWRPWQESQTLM